MSGVHRTIAHYKRKLLEKAEKFNKPRQLDPYFKEMIGDSTEVSILDVGSGPFPIFGTEYSGVSLKITLVDMLADKWNDLLANSGIVPIIRVEKGDMEHLLFPAETFDIVHCVNAIDHTTNALRAIEELFRVCRRGGWIYLRHYVNVGDRCGYGGMHQWNVSKDGLIWNKEKTASLKGFRVWFDSEARMVTMIGKNVEGSCILH